MELRILGPLEAVDFGSVLALGGGNSGSCWPCWPCWPPAPEAISTDPLIDCLWGDDPPPRPEGRSKVFYPMGDGPNDRGLSRQHVIRAAEASLGRHGTDIDLHQIQRWDEGTPVEETMHALDDLVRSGKVRYIGASTNGSLAIRYCEYTARAAGWTEFVSMQNLYNLAYREDGRELASLGRGHRPHAVQDHI